jgi:hypothetical protein
LETRGPGTNPPVRIEESKERNHLPVWIGGEKDRIPPVWKEVSKERIPLVWIGRSKEVIFLFGKKGGRKGIRNVDGKMEGQDKLSKEFALEDIIIHFITNRIMYVLYVGAKGRQVTKILLSLVCTSIL